MFWASLSRTVSGSTQTSLWIDTEVNPLCQFCPVVFWNNFSPFQELKKIVHKLPQTLELLHQFLGIYFTAGKIFLSWSNDENGMKYFGYGSGLSIHFLFTWRIPLQMPTFNLQHQQARNQTGLWSLFYVNFFGRTTMLRKKWLTRFQ